MKKQELVNEVDKLNARIKELEQGKVSVQQESDITIYEALDRCLVLGVQLEPGQKIGLTEEHEKTLKLGKFAEDPKPGEEKNVNRNGKIGYGWLQLAGKTRVESNKLIDGAIFYPVEKNSQPKEYQEAGIGPRPTQWGSNLQEALHG